MVARCPLPARASVRDLLTDLLGCEVSVGEAKPFELSDERRAMLATYRFDDDKVAAAIACDLPLAASTGAAIGMLPSEDVTRVVAESALDGDMAEFFQEIVNVTAKLLNGPTTPHVALDEVFPVPGDVPADVAELVLEPGVRSDYAVAVDGYTDGTMVLVTR